jgi:exopolysaccharide biosynthesis polyprenyl glycosylphosphotransferase
MVPDLMDFLPQKVAPGALGQLPLVELFADPLRGFWGSLKRAVDVAAAAGLLVFLSPLLGFIAFAVRWDSRGPALFRQRRMGRDGRPFTLYKFRTMAHGADESSHRDYLEKLIDGGDGGRGNEVERHQPLFKLNDDRRVTRVGRLLRPLSLDELPQLLNVLTGDMSLVGPRPAIEYEVERYRSWQRKRLDVSPGLTGLWQVSGRNRLSFEEMVRLDVYYIENWSPWMDLRILLQTPAAILRRETR